MKTKIILFIIISILFTGCSPSKASTSSEQSEQSAPQSNPSADNQQLSQAQFEEIFDFYCEEQLTDFDGIEVIPALHGIDEEAFAISGEIVNGQLIYQCVTDYIAPQLWNNRSSKKYGKDLQSNLLGRKPQNLSGGCRWKTFIISDAERTGIFKRIFYGATQIGFEI